MKTVNNRRSERGVGLMEILVALSVLSFGLLGAAAMQAQSLKSGTDAIQRAKAVLFAVDITDRMRANLAGINNYQVAIGQDIGAWASPECMDTTSSATNCTSQQMAQYDVYQWKQTIENTSQGLPNGDAAIQPVAGTPGRFTITVQWTPREGLDTGSVDDGNGAQVNQYLTQVQLQ